MMGNKKAITGHVFAIIIGILTIVTYICYMPSSNKAEGMTELIQWLFMQ